MSDENPTVQDAVEHDTEVLRELKRAFQFAFSSPAGQAVLNDLRPFCRAERPCWDADARFNALLEGRREVWLHIQNYLTLSPEELFARRVARDPYTPRLNTEKTDA